MGMIQTLNVEKQEAEKGPDQKPKCGFMFLMRGPLGDITTAWVPIEVLEGKTVHVLNALIPYPGVIALTPMMPECVARLGVLRGVRFVSYVGHGDTVRILEELLATTLGESKAKYTPQEGDIALVARLKGGGRGVGNVTGITAESLEYWLAVYA